MSNDSVRSCDAAEDGQSQHELEKHEEGEGEEEALTHGFGGKKEGDLAFVTEERWFAVSAYVGSKEMLCTDRSLAATGAGQAFDPLRSQLVPAILDGWLATIAHLTGLIDRLTFRELDLQIDHLELLRQLVISPLLLLKIRLHIIHAL